MELAQQQGNQAAPNLLDAALAGEFGGGGSSYILPEQAAFTFAELDDYPVEAAQADETVAQTLYDNMKIVSPKLAFFHLKEIYTPESEEQEPQAFIFMALSSEFLDFCKNNVDAVSQVEPGEIYEDISALFNSLTPDELFTIEKESAEMISGFALLAVTIGIGELPPACSGLAAYRISETGNTSAPYYYECTVFPSGLMAFTHTGTTILSTPVKLEKPMYGVDIKF